MSGEDYYPEDFEKYHLPYDILYRGHISHPKLTRKKPIFDTFRHCLDCGKSISAKAQNKTGYCAKCHARRMGKANKK